MRQFLAVTAAALLLAACATGASPATHEIAALSASCQTVATGIDAAAPLRASGKLSAGAVATITGIRDATAPYCGTASVVDPTVAATFVAAAAAQLTGILAGVK